MGISSFLLMENTFAGLCPHASQFEYQSHKRYQIKARCPGFQISIISILLRALRLCIACPKHWLSWEELEGLSCRLNPFHLRKTIFPRTSSRLKVKSHANSLAKVMSKKNSSWFDASALNCASLALRAYCLWLKITLNFIVFSHLTILKF